jgi:hypothetical protein
MTWAVDIWIEQICTPWTWWGDSEYIDALLRAALPCQGKDNWRLVNSNMGALVVSEAWQVVAAHAGAAFGKVGQQEQCRFLDA